MIKRITNYIDYRRKLKFLKMYTVFTLSNLVINKADYINGFQKLMLTASKSDDAEELQKMLNEFIDLANKTKIVNDIVNKNKEK